MTNDGLDFILDKKSAHFHIVLVQPQIPQNTGNIGRLCVATNTTLHLVHPLGFDLSEKAVRRAGLDYWQHLDLVEHDTFNAFLNWSEGKGRHWYITKFANQSFFEPSYKDGDFFIFGKETTGIKNVDGIGADSGNSLRIPMFDDRVRSLNLANSASIVLYEALRQSI